MIKWKNQPINEMTFCQLITAIKELNYLKLEYSEEMHIDGISFQELNYKLITELNLRSYEGKLYKQNLKKLGCISRPKYDRIVAITKQIIPDDLFTTPVGKKFEIIRRTINTEEWAKRHQGVAA